MILDFFWLWVINIIACFYAGFFVVAIKRQTMSEVWAPNEKQKAQHEIHINLTGRFELYIQIWSETLTNVGKVRLQKLIPAQIGYAKKTAYEQHVWT